MASYSGNNSYVDNCDVECHKDCLFLKKVAPFPVIEACAAQKCGCNHSLSVTQPPAPCSRECRDECLDNKKIYSWSSDPFQSMMKCVVQCGCQQEMEANLNITYVPTPEIQQADSQISLIADLPFSPESSASYAKLAKTVMITIVAVLLAVYLGSQFVKSLKLRRSKKDNDYILMGGQSKMEAVNHRDGFVVVVDDE